MNKWQKIKGKIYQEKLNDINDLFIEVSNNISDNGVPRDRWLAPIENWAKEQLSKNDSFRLSLQEYAHLKKMFEDMDQDFISQYGNEKPVVNKFNKELTESYLEMLAKKENDLKLEVTAYLIEQNQFPLDIFIEWYKNNSNLPINQFNERLGDFWGDVWRHAAGGAGAGALAGGVVGGVPTGGLGTFAGAGLGALTGGFAGGIYGGGKHLYDKYWNKEQQPGNIAPEPGHALAQVWKYRKNQVNFEKTKEKALEALKNLRNLSNEFEMNPKFIAALDSMIEQLGTIQAYRVKPPPTSPIKSTGKINPLEPVATPTDQDAEVGEAVPETAKKEITPAKKAGGTKLAIFRMGMLAHKNGVKPEKNPYTQPDDKFDTDKAAIWHKGWKKAEDVAREAAMATSSKIHKPETPEEEEASFQAAKADAIGKPTETPKEEGIKLETPQDVVNLYEKAQKENDESTIFKIGYALYENGKRKPEDMDSVNLARFKDMFDKSKDFIPEDLSEFSQEDKETYFKTAKMFIDRQKEKESISTGAPGKVDLAHMSEEDFINHIKSLGKEKLLGQDIEKVGKPGTNAREKAIEILNYAIQYPESVVQKYKKMLQESRKPALKYKIASLPVTERVKYIKELLRS